VLLFKPRLHVAWAVWVEYMWMLPLLEKIQHGFESAFQLEIALWSCERDQPEKVHRLTVELQQLRQSLVLGDDGWKEEKRIQNSAPPKKVREGFRSASCGRDQATICCREGNALPNAKSKYIPRGVPCTALRGNVISRSLIPPVTSEYTI
jgi:hypothetical protein